MPSSRNTKEQLLSLADIARHFSLPESTTRYYCKRFAAFMPSQGEGRRRRYRQESLGVIAAILEHMGTERTAAGVEEVLRRQFPCTTDLVVHTAQTAPTPVRHSTNEISEQDMLPALALRLLEQQAKSMEGIAASLHILASRQNDLHTLTASARAAADENDNMRQEIHTLRTLLQSSEKVHQEDLDQIRTWVTRIAMRGQHTSATPKA